jgi:hypothetical protein
LRSATSRNPFRRTAPRPSNPTSHRKTSGKLKNRCFCFQTRVITKCV